MSDIDQEIHTEATVPSNNQEVDKDVEASRETQEGQDSGESQEGHDGEEMHREDTTEASPAYGSEDEDKVISSIKAKKIANTDERFNTHKKLIRRSKPHVSINNDDDDESYPISNDQPSQEFKDDLNPQQRRRLELEEKMTAAIKVKSNRRRKADEDDIERMQDDKIEHLKEQMINAANLDVEKNSQGQIATEKLKLLEDVLNILSRADLAESILDNNLLEAVRLWLEPLPDASMPAYQIQKELINSLQALPIKTDHLVASGIGKVLVFYQRSKRTEPSLKKVVDRLIGDWTRPILNKSDSYKDRSIQFGEYNKARYSNKLSSGNKQTAPKTLYEQNAERRKRAAIPTARTAAYKIAPRVDPNLLARGRGSDERFKKLNQKLTSMGTRRKVTKKGGPSIEGRDLSI
ncbi:IWS1 [Candida margitis]|uniref:IWS1 n=1 Tax=Candida margitis TaxID=1775924 RepID=UPI00222638DD|nr:IWS1 [Candida margitis]KAI5961522.1 IWS1 [Candida margitis]